MIGKATYITQYGNTASEFPGLIWFVCGGGTGGIYNNRFKKNIMPMFALHNTLHAILYRIYCRV